MITPIFIGISITVGSAFIIWCAYQIRLLYKREKNTWYALMWFDINDKKPTQTFYEYLKAKVVKSCKKS